MARRERTRLAGWLEGDGIEIGALHRPLPVPDGAHVTYVDVAPVERLQELYPELGGEFFAPVSVIATAEDLSSLPDGSQDFVIANHLLEHVELPIKALLEFQRLLRPGGILFMALPDGRLSFDKQRLLTTVEHLVEEQRNGPEPNRRAHYVDWATNVEGLRGAEADRRVDGYWEKEHRNIHFHVWTPDSFLDFLVAARREFDLEFELVGYAVPEHKTEKEFIVVLARAQGAVRFPPDRRERAGAEERPSFNVRHRLAASRLGPPVRLVKGLLRSP